MFVHQILTNFQHSAIKVTTPQTRGCTT